MSIERRRTVRHLVYLPAELVRDGSTPRLAITKDISEHGLLLLTRTKLDPGEGLVVRIYLPGGETEFTDVRGSVARLEELSDDEKGIWRNKLAFTFEAAQPELAEQFKTLAESQAKLYSRTRSDARK